MSGVLAEFDRDWAPEPGDTADLLAIREWLVARTGTESEVEALVDALFARKYQRAEVPESFDQSRKSELREVAAMVLAAGYRLAPSVPDGARETALRERIEALAGQWERLARVKNSYSEIRHSHARDLRAALAAEDES